MATYLNLAGAVKNMRPIIREILMPGGHTLGSAPKAWGLL